MVAVKPGIAPADAVRASLRGKRFDVGGRVFELLLLSALLISLLFLVVLLFEVISEGLPVFQERGVDFLTGPLDIVLPSIAGVGQGIMGSLQVALVVALVALPLGVGAAIYLEEYAPNTKFTRFISVNIRNLAGVPAIVYGLLGLVIFVQIMRPMTGGKSVISGGLTLAVLVLPIVIITASEALRAVPGAIREAGIGVGATKWQVVRSHVLPAAAPGILTGVILSISRAIGETAPLLIVGATTGFLATGNASFYEQLYGRYTTLPTIVYRWSSLPSSDFRALTSAAIMVLLLMTLTANAVAIVLRNRYARKW